MDDRRGRSLTRTANDSPLQDPHAGSRHATLEAVIGRRVREVRGRLGLTLAALASAAGLSPGMLSKIENGGTSPSLATLQRLTDALAVPVTALFRGCR